MKFDESQHNVCIITFPLEKSGIKPLSNFLDIIKYYSDEIYLITGNDGYEYFKKDETIFTYQVNHEKGSNPITQIFRYVNTQIIICYKMLKKISNVDVLFFSFGGENLIFAMILGRLLRKKIVIRFSTSFINVSKTRNDTFLNVITILEHITLKISHNIIVKSKNSLSEHNLEKYENKVLIAQDHFINFNNFKIFKDINERESIVGYVGRFNNEKGILNFVKSIPLLVNQNNKIKFLIIGKGELSTEIKSYVENNNLNRFVTLLDWIDNADLPIYLNKLKLLVVPSYTETGPLIALESIACGTPVLSTNVGNIPNIIKDGETGFILDNNSPEVIADKIKIILENDLENGILKEVVINSQEFIKKNYNYDNILKQYKTILNDIWRKK